MPHLPRSFVALAPVVLALPAALASAVLILTSSWLPAPWGILSGVVGGLCLLVSLAVGPWLWARLRQEHVHRWSELAAWLEGRVQQAASRELPQVPEAVERGLRLVDSTLALQAERIAASDLVDPATGIMSRLAFLRRVDDEMKRSARFDRPMALACLTFPVDFTDPEDFAKMTRLLRGYARSIDLIARLDTFSVAILLPETSVEGAVGLGQRLLNDVEDTLSVAPGVGVVGYPRHALSTEQLVIKGERAAHAGLNCEGRVWVADDFNEPSPNQLENPHY